MGLVRRSHNWLADTENIIAEPEEAGESLGGHGRKRSFNFISSRLNKTNKLIHFFIAKRCSPSRPSTSCFSNGTLLWLHLTQNTRSLFCYRHSSVCVLACRHPFGMQSHRWLQLHCTQPHVDSKKHCNVLAAVKCEVRMCKFVLPLMEAQVLQSNMCANIKHSINN